MKTSMNLVQTEAFGRTYHGGVCPKCKLLNEFHFFALRKECDFYSKKYLSVFECTNCGTIFLSKTDVDLDLTIKYIDLETYVEPNLMETPWTIDENTVYDCLGREILYADGHHSHPDDTGCFLDRAQMETLVNLVNTK